MKHSSIMTLLFGVLAVLAMSVPVFAMERGLPVSHDTPTVLVQFNWQGDKRVEFGVPRGWTVAEVKRELESHGYYGYGLRYKGNVLKDSDPFPVIESVELFLPQKSTFPYKPVAAIGAAAATAAVLGAIYTGLKWYQRKRIRRVLVNHDLTLSDISPTQKDAMAAAVLASSKVPGSMWPLKKAIQKGKLTSDAISNQTMWAILAELYYRKAPTVEEIQILEKQLV